MKHDFRSYAPWLVENTCLTFTQISIFCKIHDGEVQAVADGENLGAGQSNRDPNPVLDGRLTREEIKKCENDENLELKMNRHFTDYLESISRPMPKNAACRAQKPLAIKWLLLQCPEIPNTVAATLLKTTWKTVNSVRDGTHKKISGDPVDPASINLCAQEEIDEVLQQYKIQKELQDCRQEINADNE